MKKWTVCQWIWGFAITYEGEIYPCGFAIETGEGKPFLWWFERSLSASYFKLKLLHLMLQL
jgi:hypothetical protein